MGSQEGMPDTGETGGSVTTGETVTAEGIWLAVIARRKDVFEAAEGQHEKAATALRTLADHIAQMRQGYIPLQGARAVDVGDASHPIEEALRTEAGLHEVVRHAQETDGHVIVLGTVNDQAATNEGALRLFEEMLVGPGRRRALSLRTPQRPYGSRLPCELSC